MERILVTGAAGFIGSSLVDRLLATGSSVVGVDNFDPFYPRAEKRQNLATALPNPDFTLIDRDCTDLGAMEEVLSKNPVDIIVHLAAKAGVRPSIADPLGYIHTNVVGTQVILEAARRYEIRNVVFASSSSVYGDTTPVPFSEDALADQPLSPYAASKRSCEMLCATSSHLFGMNIIALRFFTVYGPRQRPDLAIRKFATLMLKGSEIPMFGDGTTARDYTWIEDILDGVMASVAHVRRMNGCFDIVNLGSSRLIPLKELVALLSSALNVEARVKTMPPQPGDVRTTFADVRKANKILGYAPHTPMEEGIRQFAAWMLERRDASASERPSDSPELSNARAG